MKVSKILVAVALFALVATVAAAGYLMISPSSDDVTVNPLPIKATLSKPALSDTILTVGDSLTLTTTVSDATAGITVSFFNQNDVEVGTAVTDATGTATITITPPEGTWSFYATATHP